MRNHPGHRHHRHQADDNFWKAAFCSFLLFLMLWCADLYNIFSDTIDYAYWNENKDGSFDYHSLTPFKEKMNWAVKNIAERWNVLIACIIYIINPRYGKLDYFLKSMWVSYYVFRIYTFSSSYDAFPWITEVKLIVIIIQICVTFYLRSEIKWFLSSISDELIRVYTWINKKITSAKNPKEGS